VPRPAGAHRSLFGDGELVFGASNPYRRPQDPIDCDDHDPRNRRCASVESGS
jgi:hypothetical protein